MANPAAKAHELMAQAQEKKNMHEQGGGGSGGLCCGGKSKVKIEEVCEIYVKAANSFKIAKDWGSAGRAFAEAAALEVDNKRPHEAQSHFAEAAKCYKKVNSRDCAKCLEQCIEISIEMGRTRVAAKHHQALAELYEEDESVKDLAKSAQHYGFARDLFSGDESKSGANTCELQVAKLSALSGDFATAAEIYEEKGQNALDSNLLKYTASSMYLRSGLCRLQMLTAEGNFEAVGPKMAEIIAKYEDSNPAFADSRESILLKGLVQGVSEGDVDIFNEAVRNHESVSRLEPWFHEVIKIIRKYISNPDLR